MKTPQVNTIVKMESLKHDKSFHRSWEENTILFVDGEKIIGVNDKTIVHEPNQQPWRTDDLALFYLPKNHWFNIVILFKSKINYSFYCNISSPPTYHHGVIQYIDYDIDVIVNKDYTFQVVDLEEFEQNKQQMIYPLQITKKIESELLLLKLWIENKQNPFNEQFIWTWYDRYVHQ